MYCKYCGQMIDDDSRFCPYCGKDLGSSSEVFRVIADQQEDELEQKAGKALKLAWASVFTLPLIIVPAALAFLAILYAKQAKYSKKASEKAKKAKRIAYISYFIIAAVVIGALFYAVKWYADWIMEQLNF